MGVWIYQYCTVPTAPSIREVLDWMQAQGQAVTLFEDDFDEEDDVPLDRDSHEWSQFELVDEQENMLMLAHLHRADSDFGKSDINMLRQLVLKQAETTLRTQILDHLARCSFVVGSQQGLQTGLIEAQEVYERYFIEHCHAMTFYDSIAVVKLPDGSKLKLSAS